MILRVNFIFRRDRETGSIESVFGEIGRQLESRGVEVISETLPFANSAAGMLANLAAFRPKKADIYHITGHAHYAALRLPRARTVLTVHDLNILRTRSGFRRRLLKKLLYDWPIARLEYVTAISAFTKEQIVALTGCDEAKVRVIMNPLGSGFERKAKPFNVDRPTILQVGTAPHKNLETLAAAIAGIRCRLKIIGELSDSQRRRLDESELDYENAVGLDADGMRREYAQADMVAFCSTYEGFGLPVIEAQASETPLITSLVRPICEIAGEGAVKVDPLSPSDIRRAVETMITNSDVRKAAVEAGLENVKRFEPKLIAEQYLNLYKEILSRPSRAGL